MTRQKLHRGRRDSGDFLLSTGIFRKARQKQVGQTGNIFLVLAQRRDVDRDDVKPVVQILSKRSFFERCQGSQLQIDGTLNFNCVESESSHNSRKISVQLFAETDRIGRWHRV